ncbi:MAG TPA: hypothetical protein ACFE0H_08515 [Elainellaceae cyanobacterium]
MTRPAFAMTRLAFAMTIRELLRAIEKQSQGQEGFRKIGMRPDAAFGAILLGMPLNRRCI